MAYRQLRHIPAAAGWARQAGPGLARREQEVIAPEALQNKRQRSWAATLLAWPWVRGRGSGGGSPRRSGVIKPLAVGQFEEMGPGLFETLLAGMAKRGADELADRYLIENREAAVGVQVFHMRQRWGAAVWGRKRRPPLIGRSALHRGGERLSRAVSGQ
jgi:hypothetical protein